MLYFHGHVTLFSIYIYDATPNIKVLVFTIVIPPVIPVHEISKYQYTNLVIPVHELINTSTRI